MTKKSNGKPIVNAAVVFNPTKDGKDIGSLEVKTDPDGKATIDVIPTGSKVRVQIIADGFATFADDYLVTEPTREIDVVMLRPQEQISAYENNEGKARLERPEFRSPINPRLPLNPAQPRRQLHLPASAQSRSCGRSEAVASHDSSTRRQDCAGHRRGQANRTHHRAEAGRGWCQCRDYLSWLSDRMPKTRLASWLLLTFKRWPCAATWSILKTFKQMMASVIDEFGQLDFLVNNAGMFASEALEAIYLEQWDEMFATNTRAPFLVAQAAYPHLRAAVDASSTLGRSAACIPGQRTRTTVPRRPPAHAVADHGQGLGSRDQR